MTKEELREHCERQVRMCEEWAKGNGREPSGKIYEEHKLILDLIKALEQQPCEDCEHNDGECCRLLFEESFNKSEIPTSDDCVSRQAVKDLIMKLEKPCDDIQDFYIDSTQELEVEIDNLLPCTPTHGTCKDCKHLYDVTRDRREDVIYPNTIYYCRMHNRNIYNSDFYCADFERRE